MEVGGRGYGKYGSSYRVTSGGRCERRGGPVPGTGANQVRSGPGFSSGSRARCWARSNPRTTLWRDTPSSPGYLSHGEAVVADDGVADPGPCRDGRRAMTGAAELAAVHREAVGRYAEQFQHNLTGRDLRRRGAVCGQVAQDLGHELAGAENPLIEGPRLSASLERRGGPPGVPAASYAPTDEIGPAPLRDAVANELPVVGASGLERGPEVESGGDESQLRKVRPVPDSIAREQCHAGDAGVRTDVEVR